ncbi:hypothetical protein FQA39_LY09871 [Lamprigera yunnana]|nr:hypothetical protein FQA39_LY09871 [Lamprigera yunnana]
MDIQSALIGVAVFLISAGILLFISMFGIKEKSYEEALAEQRQQANALLGVQQRSKPKEKKAKKIYKKGKEKQSSSPGESETTDDVDDKPLATTNTHQKLHVEFKEPAAQPVVTPTLESSSNKKRGKKDKIRPILIHKSLEKDVIVHKVDASPANHFERLHPKDDLELLHLHLRSKDEVSKVDSSKEKAKPKQSNVQEKDKGGSTKPKQNIPEVKEKKKQEVNVVVKEKQEVKEKTKEKLVSTNHDAQKTKKVSEKIPVTEAPVIKKEEPVVKVPVVTSQTNGYVTNSTSNKEKKRKKAEIHQLQVLAAKDGDISLPLLLNVVRKAELSRSEVQILIDLLLNKQHEAPAVVDQWSEGKADPVQKLKKQLAEKEKALAEEQEALVGVQAKLREVRAEQAAEKVQLQQRNRGFEEALQAKHLELQSANSRLHSQNQKLQQMQTQINEESIAMRKLHEENTALQLQRQQIDIHISQVQEAEATIQDLQTRNNQLTMELHTLTDQNMASKDHQQSIIVQLQHQVNVYKTELEDKDNYNRQIEELRRDLEHRLGLSIRQENELKAEIGKLTSVCQQNAEDIRCLEHSKTQALEEIHNLQKQKDELDLVLSQLKMELRDIEVEKSELQQIKENGLAQENQVHKEELLSLHNELSSVTQENQMHKDELLSLHNELSSFKYQLQFVETKYSSDLNASKHKVTEITNELEEHKNKNNELRQKNWKVMEALKAAENKSMEPVVPTINLDEIVSKIKTEEQELHRKFIQRLFPDISISNDLPSEQWSNSVEQTIKKYVSDLENLKSQDTQAEVSKLQAQVKHYKNIIDDTEGILKKLQNHIEQEEIHWRNELKIKETEMDTLKQTHLVELQTTVEHLENRLKLEEQEKEKIVGDTEKLKSRTTIVIDNLTQEVNNLKDQILTEQRKNEELLKHSEENTNQFLVKEQSINNSTNGPSIEASAV